MLHLLRSLPGIEDLAPDIDELLARVENISRQLGRWIDSIKDSGFKGARSQTAQTRERAQAVKCRDECLAKLRAIQEAAARMATSSTEGEPRDGEPSRG